MCSLNKLQSLDRAYRQNRLEQRIAQLADLLLAELGWAWQGRERVPYLADARCVDHRDALRCWVGEQLEEEEAFAAGAELPALRKRLTQRLQDCAAERLCPLKGAQHTPPRALSTMPRRARISYRGRPIGCLLNPRATVPGVHP